MELKITQMSHGMALYFTPFYCPMEHAPLHFIGMIEVIHIWNLKMVVHFLTIYNPSIHMF